MKIISERNDFILDQCAVANKRGERRRPWKAEEKYKVPLRGKSQGQKLWLKKPMHTGKHDII